MGEYELSRLTLADGERTTVYVVRHRAHVRVLFFPGTERLDVWCSRHGVAEAIVAGFFLRDPYRALGEVRVGGRPVPHEPVAEPYGPLRACVAADGDGVRLGPRHALGEPSDLVQAGPLLVAGGVLAFVEGEDREGFSAAAGQFDSDITAERHPRAALGVAGDHLIAVACDGRRTGVDAGLSMLELAELMLELGSETAINLDGGGSATLVHRGHLLNRPYSSQDQPAPQTREIVTALAFE
jgi:phosphodiester glycosidase